MAQPVGSRHRSRYRSTCAPSEAGSEAIPFDVIVNFDNGAIDSAMTAAKMNAGTHGAALGTWAIDLAITHSLVADNSVALPFPIVVDGVTYDGQSGKGLTFDRTSDAVNSDVFIYAFSGTVNDLALMLVAKWDLSGGTADYNNDVLDIEGNGYAVPQMFFHTTGETLIGSLPHTQFGTGGRVIPYVVGEWRVICLRITSGGVFELYHQDLDGALLYASRTVMDPVMSAFTFVKLQSYLTAAASPNGWTGSIQMNSLAMRDDAATFPFTTLSIQAPSSVVAEQTGISAITVTITTIGSYVQIERNLNSGGFSVIEAGINIGTTGEYEDTDLSDGDTAIYRATLLVGTQSSAASASSNTVTVDDAPYSGVWQDTIAPGSTDSTNSLANTFTLMAKLTVSGGGTCSKVRIYKNNAGTVGSIKMALYDNGSPKNLLGSGIAALVSGPAYTEVTLSAPVTGLANGQVIWIAFNPQTDNACDARYLNGGAANTTFDSQNYADFPTSTFTGSTLTRTYAASAYIY